MKEYKLTDEQRKMLTELLGEKWRVITTPHASIGGNCDCDFCKIDNRTFATDSDMMAVYRKLVDNNMWDSFYWSSGIDEIPISGLFYIPETFCWLVWSFINNQKST